ncbi:MAG: type II toxin-antitoxin system VapC family toxin [Actinobacteria bacterium]|nr:type II toxin-antitoxin system VapC family toxin [Actinomycetota bacterium]
MNLVDANVLIYAVNESDPKHEVSREWLDSALGGPEAVAFSWFVLLAFLRLTTKVGLLPDPLPVADAMATIGLWLDQPPSVVVGPTERHLGVLRGLLLESGTGGNLTSDAHLAALSIEHGATIISHDADFSRFDGVRWRRPRDDG